MGYTFSMRTSFQRIYTADGLELHGLLHEPEQKTDSILVHVHGMGGNFYENKFLDFIAKELTNSGIAFCTFNNRGCEFLKETYQTQSDGASKIVRVGTSYEVFEESVRDIESFTDFASSFGFSNIHLSGHSLGCSKVVYYMIEKNDVRIKSLLLLSPSDMLGLVRGDQDVFTKQISEAEELVAEGKGEQLLSDWLWGEYPISARSYLSLFADDAKDAIFNFYDKEDPLSSLSTITIPVYSAMGRKDDALTIPIEESFARLKDALVSSAKVKTEILGDANHGYRGHEQELAGAVKDWLLEVVT
jgi:pimeloyl-ACP methyl ester carboxylesterase